MLNDAPPSMDGKVATLAAGHLFKVNEENPKILDKEREGVVCSLGNAGVIFKPERKARHQDSHFFLMWSSVLP